jgi:hypothetical protein
VCAKCASDDGRAMLSAARASLHFGAMREPDIHRPFGLHRQAGRQAIQRSMYKSAKLPRMPSPPGA